MDAGTIDNKRSTHALTSLQGSQSHKLKSFFLSAQNLMKWIFLSLKI